MNLADIYHFKRIVYQIIWTTSIQKYKTATVKTKARV